MAPTKNSKLTRVNAVLFNHRLAALSPSQRRKGASWLVRNGLADIKTLRQLVSSQNAMVAYANNCSTRTMVKHLRVVDAAAEEADPGVVVVQPNLSQELKAERMEHLKTTKISLALATAAQTAQDEAASLKMQLKVAKAQYTTRANETEADHATTVAALYRMYEEKCNLIRQMGKNHDTHIKFLNDRIEGVKMMQVEMDALKASLIAEKNKNKTLVDTLSNMSVIVD